MSKTYNMKVSAAATKQVERPSASSMVARPRESITAPFMNEFKVGPFSIRVSNKQHYRLYSICAPTGELIGKQASYPSIYDCLEKTDRAAGNGSISHDIRQALYKSRETSRALAERAVA